MQALMCPLDYLWTPSTIQEDLEKRSSASRLTSILFFFFFWGGMIRFTLVELLRSWAGLVKDKYCNVDVDDALLPELVDDPGTTRRTKLTVLYTIVFPSLVKRGFWPLTHSQEYPWSSQSFPNDRIADVSSSNRTVTNRFRSWTLTCTSLLLRTSPLAVSITAGFLDLCKVCHLSELKIFFAQHVRWCSWIDNEFSILWSFRSGSFVRFLELVNILHQVQCYSASASILEQSLVRWSFPEFWRARTTLMRFALLNKSLRWTHSFPIFSIVSGALGEFVGVFCTQFPFSSWLDFLG